MNQPLPALTPENEVLNTKLEKLRLQFLELFMHHKDMVENRSVILTALYLKKIGDYQLQLLRKQTEAARLKLKMNMIQAAINRDEKPNLRRIDKNIEKQLQDYYAEIAAQAEALNSANNVLSNLLPEAEVIKLKEIFRVLCKRLHPDLNPGQGEDEKDLFVKVKTAYELQRLEVLQNILLYLDHRQNNHPPAMDADTKQQRVEQLEKNIAALEEKIEALKLNFPFSVEAQIYDEDYISARRAEIEENIEKAEAEIEKYKNIINIMCDE